MRLAICRQLTTQALFPFLNDIISKIAGVVNPNTRVHGTKIRGHSGSVSTPNEFGACSVARSSSCRYLMRDGNFSIATDGSARSSSTGSEGARALLMQVLPSGFHARPALRLPRAARVLRPELSTH